MALTVRFRRAKPAGHLRGRGAKRRVAFAPRVRDANSIETLERQNNCGRFSEAAA